MRLGLSSAAFYGRREVEDTAALLPGYGLNVCEVFLNSFSEYSTTFGGLVRERLNGLPCVSVHPKGTQFEPDIFSVRRIKIAPAVCLFGFLSMIYAVLRKPKTQKTEK